MVEIKHNRGETHEVKLSRVGQDQVALPPSDIYERVKKAYLREQQMLHPGVPQKVGLGERILNKIIGERRREVQI